MKKIQNAFKVMCPIALGLLLVLFPTKSSGATGLSQTSLDDLRPSATKSSGDLGIGVMVGDPTGLTLKSWLNRSNAVQVGLAYTINNCYALQADYLWQFRLHQAPEFSPYLGAGVEVLFNNGGLGNAFHNTNDAASLALRVPVGFEWLPRKSPLGLFVEITPSIALVPGPFGFFQGDMGIRFYL